MSLTKFVGLLAGSTLTLTSVSYGAAEANNDTAAEIQSLKAEIAAMKASQGEQWLTEARAEQIRGVVQDVLSDSSTRTSFQAAGGPTAGYDNGFFMASADGNWKFKINALEQARFVYNNTFVPTTGGPGGSDQNTWGFENRRTQLFFSGNVVDPSWKYLIGIAYDAQSDPYVPVAGAFQVLYAQVTKVLGEGFSLTVGQQNVPWTFESNLFNAGATQMGDYSIFEYVFGAGQSTGASLMWQNDALRVNAGWFNTIEHAAGASTQGWNNTGNQSYALAARADWKISGIWEQFTKESSFKGEEFGAKVGGSLIWQNGRRINNPPVDGSTWPSNPFGFNADVAFNFGGANIIAQFAWVDDLNPAGGSTWGLNVQGGFFVTDDLEIFGAMMYDDQDDANWYVQFGTNWYFAKNNVKATVMAIIPLAGDSAAAGTSAALRGYEGGIGLSPQDNNFSIMAQIQMMF